MENFISSSWSFQFSAIETKWFSGFLRYIEKTKTPCLKEKPFTSKPIQKHFSKKCQGARNEYDALFYHFKNESGELYELRFWNDTAGLFEIKMPSGEILYAATGIEEDENVFLQ